MFPKWQTDETDDVFFAVGGWGGTPKCLPSPKPCLPANKRYDIPVYAYEPRICPIVRQAPLNFEGLPPGYEYFGVEAFSVKGAGVGKQYPAQGLIEPIKQIWSYYINYSRLRWW